MFKNTIRTINMLCGVCGNDQFETMVETETDVEMQKCSDCGTQTTKEQLLSDNQHVIDANVEELKKDMINQFSKEIRKIFK